MLQYCADKNSEIAFYGSLIAGIASVAVIIFSWMPFTRHFNKYKDWQFGKGNYEYSCPQTDEQLDY